MVVQNINIMHNEVHNKYAKDLYGDKGYIVIKNFMPKEDIDIIKNHFFKNNFEVEIDEIEKMKGSKKFTNDYFHFLTEYFYQKKDSNKSKTVMKYIDKCFKLRSSIGLQRNSDQLLLDYCQQHNLDITDLEAIKEAQFSHSFTRISQYRNNEGQPLHYDNPGEIQCIIYLTQRGVDYESGGVVLVNDTEEIDVDSLVKSGDLLILNAYKKEHKVVPVKCSDSQKGRMQLFIPMIPEYLFPKSYFFEDNKMKLFFQRNIGTCDKVGLYINHFIKLLCNKAESIDSDKKSVQSMKYKKITVKNKSFLKQLINKKIYISPFNAHSMNIVNQVDIKFSGYFDDFKIGDDIYKYNDNINFDYVLISETRYFDNIANRFPSDKILVIKNDTIEFYKQGCK